MANKSEKNQINGWITINKPVGVSSTYVTNNLKRILRPKKIGHAGTLDPAACGVLNIALGEATKAIEYVQDLPKTYKFTVRFGEATDTLDLEGEIIEKNDIFPTLKQIESVIPQFLGKIKQTPPKYSALKIDGKRAYDLARQGVEFEIKEREIEVYDLKLDDWKLETGILDPRFREDDTAREAKQLSPITHHLSPIKEATFICQCSKGTYIRTLAIDIAKACGAIGVVTFLQRVAVGGFGLENSLNFNKDLPLQENQIISHLKPIDVGLDDIPVLHLVSPDCEKLKNGQKVPTNNKNGIFRAYNNQKLFAIISVENGVMKTKKVFNL
jgi:tRNA pseudouridine55 synthase